MAYVFGTKSQAQRATLHPYLRDILDRTLALHDFSIDIGYRSPSDQDAARARGNSKVSGAGNYPHMRRADGTTWAVDVMPFINGKPVDARKFGTDAIVTGQWCRFVGMVEAEAASYFRFVAETANQHWRLRSGLNWNRDAEIMDASDRRLVDAYHFEIERVGG